ncbi:MAG: DUF1926 domain-containing protein [Candidatus Omnitrophica bacterium]|nr:DUF1926 domain-containing protein [Candidatus Omnitrophota bacterium]
MPGQVSLLMAMHCHQPVGNFDFVFERAVQEAYAPFLDALDRHRGIRISLHYSGPLLEWLQARQPRFLARLTAFVRRGQVELLGSGRYEPILAILPEADRDGQLRGMQRLLQRQFGVRPTGAWLTERVWEPDVASTLVRNRVRYTLVDTRHFQTARGLVPEALQVEDDDGWDLLGCYTTEHGGEPLIVFPASRRLRYWLPFQEAGRTIEFLKGLRRAEPTAITFADDGEKFGLWPKTHEWVYGRGWLEEFFSALDAESSWLSTETFSGYLAHARPNGRVYLPCASYEEMQEWSGGYFRNFFVRYPEANALYQAMLDISRRLGALKAQSSKLKATSRASSLQLRATRRPALVRQAQRELYQGQCNDAYWHGVFGGLYLGNLRRAIYQHLIAADRWLCEAEPRRRWDARDVDGDGAAEFVLRGHDLRAVIDPQSGGTMTQLDCVSRGINVLDTLTRRPEPYHRKLERAAASSAVAAGNAEPVAVSIHDIVSVKEPGLERHLVYDAHRRSGFVDCVLPRVPSAAELQAGAVDTARLLPDGPWTVQGNVAASSAETRLRMSRAIGGGRLEKIVAVAAGARRIRFEYALQGIEAPVVGLEWTLGLRDAQRMASGERARAAEFTVRDPDAGVAVTMRADPPGSLAYFPVETISESEAGLERTWQGVAVVWCWRTAGRRSWRCRVDWTIEAI